MRPQPLSSISPSSNVLGRKPLGTRRRKSEIEIQTRLNEFKKNRFLANKVQPTNGKSKWSTLRSKQLHQLTEKNVQSTVLGLVWKWYIIHPNHRAKLCWDFLIATVILFVCLTVPVRLCFELKDTTNWMIVDFAGDGLFVMDMFFNFFTAIEVTQSSTKIVYEKNLKVIARTYLHSKWFLIDIVSTFPFDYLAQGIGTGVGLRSLRTIRVLRLTRLLKVSRSFKLVKIMQRFQEKNFVRPAYFRLFTLLFKVLMLGHVLSCFWYYSALVRVGEGKTWLDVSSVDIDPAVTPFLTKYLWSLYWSIATLTSVGYGDVYATTTSERILSIIATILGSTVFGFIIGNIGSIMDSVDVRGTQYKRRIGDIKNYMIDRKMPWSLQKKVIKYYETYYDWKSVFEEGEILSNLPALIRHRVTRANSVQIVTNIFFFKQWCEKDMGLMTTIFAQLKPQHATVGETLSVQNDIGRELYFILNGSVGSFWQMPNITKDIIAAVKKEHGSADGEQLGSEKLAKLVLARCQLMKQCQDFDGLGRAFKKGSKVTRSRSRRLSKPKRSSTVGSGRLDRLKSKLSDALATKNTLPERVTEGSLHLVKLHRSGDHFGLMSVFLGRPQPTRYDAMSSFTFFTVNIDDMLQILSHGYEHIEHELTVQAEARFDHFKKVSTQMVMQRIQEKLDTKGPKIPVLVSVSIPVETSSDGAASERKKSRRAESEKIIHLPVAVDELIPREDLFRQTAHYMTQEETHQILYAEESSPVLKRKTSYRAEKLLNPLKQLYALIFQNAREDRKFMCRVTRSVWTKHESIRESFKDDIADTHISHYLEQADTDLYHRWMCHPSCSYKLAWDSFTTLLILYSVITVPFFVCFDIALSTEMASFHLVIDFIFFVDVIVSFRTAYLEPTTGIVDTIPSHMAMKYLKGWFWPDFVSCIPVDQVVEAYEGLRGASKFRTLKLIRTVRLVRLLKLARLSKLSRFIRFLEEVVEVPSALLKMIKLFVQVTFIGHLLACMWYFIGTQGEISVRDGSSWWAGTDLPSPEEVSSLSSAAAEMYVASMYWTLSSMTTVGYGDISATTDGERCWSIVTMLLGATVFGYIVGSMSTLVEQLDTVKARYAEKVELVKNYIRERRLPEELSKSIIMYYEQYLYRKSAFDESALLKNLSESLKREIVMFENADIVDKIPIFQGIRDDLFISNIMSIMVPVSFAGGDIVVKKGTYGQEMYFIVKGCVEVTARTDNSGKDLKTYVIIREGGSFGELSLLLNCKRSATVAALNECNMFVLHRQKLDEIMLFYPQLQSVLQNHVVSMVQGLTKRGQRLHDSVSNEELIEHMFDEHEGDWNLDQVPGEIGEPTDAGGSVKSVRKRRASRSVNHTTPSPTTRFLRRKNSAKRSDDGSLRLRSASTDSGDMNMTLPLATYSQPEDKQIEVAES